jgi:heme/copper-type cytochrome/quinol oxidase subunit 4
VRLAVAITVIAYILLFMQWLDWPFRFAAVFCVLAAIEQIVITLVMAQQHEDVRTIWQAMKFKRMQKIQDPPQ